MEHKCAQTWNSLYLREVVNGESERHDTVLHAHLRAQEHPIPVSTLHTLVSCEKLVLAQKVKAFNMCYRITTKLTSTDTVRLMLGSKPSSRLSWYPKRNPPACVAAT